jgi:hypothetical protein
MQITSSDYKYRISTKSATSSSDVLALATEVSTSPSKNANSVLPSPIDGAKSAFRSSLAANALNSHEMPLSKIPTRAGEASPALAAALAEGMVNPADWLSDSDIKLFEQTTGGTIKDGVIYDKNGNVSSDIADTQLVLSLSDLRNYGTFENGQPKLIAGEITADDLRHFIDYNRTNNAVNTDILKQALNSLIA